MPRIAAAILTWFALALPAFATCGGEDLRPTLTAAERAELQDALDGRPYASGNHWRATRGGAVLHLIGTMHLADPRFDPVIARLEPLIEDADLLLLEMTATEKNALQNALGTNPDMLLLTDTTLPELLGDADWDLLAEAMRARGVPPFMAAKFQPWYVSTLLALPACLQLDAMADAGLDARLEGLAEAQGVPMQPLEPFDTAFSAFSDVPLDLQITMIRAALAAPEASADLFTTLIDAYFEEAHAESWLVAQILTPRFAPLAVEEAEAVNARMEEVLLDQRNLAWIPVILEAVESTGGIVVAAFGAGHLSGETGVLNLLEAEGFTLERLPF